MAANTAVSAGLAAACAFQVGVGQVDPILGLSLDALIVGFVAGLAVQLHVKPQDQTVTPWRLLMYAAISSFFAGLFSPPLTSIAINHIGCPPGLTYDGVRLAIAGILGVTVHIGIPLLPGFLSRKAGAS